MRDGILFDIQRAALDDGPGVRTVLFFKGCPLSCPWCHNPESQRFAPELLTRADKCRECGACAAVCAAGAIQRAHIDRMLCTTCGLCQAACKYGALELAGRRYTVQEAVEEALRDKSFFEATGGGVTLSGGEPLAQPDFAVGILQALKRADVHTCVETCGVGADGAIASLVPYVDHWLYDVKLTDARQHQELLGAPLSVVLEGLNILKNARATITLRCVIVPGLNDNEAHFAQIRRLACDVNAAGVDILPYHRLGRDKYLHLGLEAPADILPPTEDDVAAWERAVMREE